VLNGAATQAFEDSRQSAPKVIQTDRFMRGPVHLSTDNSQ
jgi:hypothetical protein